MQTIVEVALELEKQWKEEEEKFVSEFEKRFSIDFILSKNGFYPNNSANVNTYLQVKLFSQYENDFYFITIECSLNPEGRQCVSISLYNKNDRHRRIIILHNAYECYRYFNCSGDENKAKNWKTDIFLYPTHNTVNPLSSIPYQYPIPTFDLYEYFNYSQVNRTLNLKSLIPKYLIERMANYFAEKTNMPESTLILVGLGIFSGFTCRKWNCAYQDGLTAPICLYVVAEQDASNGKSQVMDAFQKSFIDIIEKEIEKIETIISIKQEDLDAHLETEIDLAKGEMPRFKIKTKALEKELKELEKRITKANHIIPKTNITPQALEASLNYTNGFFIAAAAADEQSLIDILISGIGNKSNEVLLQGRTSGRIQPLRVSRKGYSGKVTGSFICFAQRGSIDKIIKASGVTGLC